MAGVLKCAILVFLTQTVVARQVPKYLPTEPLLHSNFQPPERVQLSQDDSEKKLHNAKEKSFVVYGEAVQRERPNADPTARLYNKDYLEEI